MSDGSINYKLAFGVSIPSFKRTQLLTDISAVVLGLKPALLVDCGLTTVSKFRFLVIDILKRLNVRENVKYCCIAGVYDDVFFINLRAMDSLWSAKCVPRYINVDKRLLSPCVLTVNTSQHDLIESMVSKVYDKLKTVVSEAHHTHKETCLDTEIPVVELHSLLRDFNLCTLFGRLLGYPIVYWFDATNGYTLDMIPLIRYMVTVKSNKETIRDAATQQCIDLFSDVSVYGIFNFSYL